MKRCQVLVLGVHRSGTSVLTATAARLGLFAGEAEDLDSGDRWNEKGYWEHRSVRALNESALETLDTTWYSVSGPVGDAIPEPERTDLKARARQVLGSLDAHGSWVVKDPRLCVLLDFWKSLLEAPAYLFALRRPLAVAGSLRQRDGFPLPMGLAIWECHLLAALAGTVGFPRAAFWYEDLVAAPEPTGMLVADWLRRVSGDTARPRNESLVGVVESGLCHQVSRETDEKRLLPASASRLLAALESGEAFQEGFDVEPSPEARGILSFADGEARKARFLERGWRAQQEEHRAAVASYEAAIREKDRFIAALTEELARRDRDVAPEP